MTLVLIMFSFCLFRTMDVMDGNSKCKVLQIIFFILKSAIGWMMPNTDNLSINGPLKVVTSNNNSANYSLTSEG